jgi:signal transduction histidine kinase
MKSTFLATVSHELRTPLTSVIGFAEMLRTRFTTSSDEDRLRMIQHIAEQGKRLGVLIEDLVDASRVEFGALRVALEPVDVAAVLERVGRSFGEREHPVFVRAEPGLPPAAADERRLEQVVTNLVANAVRHSPPGAPVELAAGLEDGRIRLAVVDHGSGIDPDFLAQLFEPFVQAGGGSGRGTGLGLGLYIVRGLVEAMGGAITASSRVGEGSEFVVRLPRGAA